MITREAALDLFQSDDLIAIGMEADRIRRQWHPEGVVSYIIDRNINYTNFCTEYCSFCAFYRAPGSAEGYILPKETIYQKIQETLDLGGTGVLMQGGLHPDLKIEWYEDLFRGIKARYPIHLHCLSAQIERFLNFLVNQFLGQDVTLGGARGAIEGAEATVLRAEVGVVDEIGRAHV